MLKLDKILEAMDSFVINSDVALLESEGLDALTIAQAKKSIHESFKFIKSELIHGGVLEETQMLLSDAWTQAIMEDIMVPVIPEEETLGLDDAALAAGGIGATGLAANYAVPAVMAGYKAKVNSGANATGTIMAAKQAAKSQYNNDLNAAKDMAAKIQTSTQNLGNAIQSSPKNFKTGYNMGSANDGLTKNIMNNGNISSKTGAYIGSKVRRIKSKFN